MIDITSSNREENDAARYKHVAPAMSSMSSKLLIGLLSVEVLSCP